MIDGQRLKQLFLKAIENSPAGPWDAQLERLGESDLELRGKLEQLLHAHAELGCRTGEPTTAVPRADDAGMIIGSYRLIERIGEGGMGSVFAAEQLTPVRRRVAVKIIKPGLCNREFIARFEAERQALAVMEHPNIARVFDAGTTTDGRPYFVMELSPGVPITSYCDRERLGIRDRLEMFLQVCDAIQHAHQKGVIHRDVKPSNLLVTKCDGKPLVKVIDFGVAKVMDHQVGERAFETSVNSVLGTPAYMSPEQASNRGSDIDTRSDVYSLGVVLYELLTGTTPHERQQLHRAPLPEALRMISEDLPAWPSKRVATLDVAVADTIAQQRGLDTRRLWRGLCGDLDWIVMTAIM